ncbi:MAG: hypothetical protein HFJ28_01100 [Clostridia bacterium]|nr:hypothetical protein [Clostridia bacterium]
MPYMDIWMYNSRPRMKVFLCYFLIFITFFIFSDIMIYCYNKSLYKPMENYEIKVANPEITISLAESSAVDGNVKGTIKNNTNEKLQDQYLKFEFYTPRDVNSGIKYLEIGELEPGQEKNYELGFRYDNVSSVKVEAVSKEQVAKATPEELEINPITGPVTIIGGILYLFL